MKKNCCWIILLFLLMLFFPWFGGDNLQTRRYLATGNTISVVPANTVLTVETTTDTFYYANAVLDDIYKTDDAGATNSRIYNGSTIITGMWLDLANDKLYFCECDGVTIPTVGKIRVKYIDLTNDNVTVVGEYDHVGADDLYACDVLLAAGGTIFIITLASNLRITVSHWGGAVWVDDDDIPTGVLPQGIGYAVKVSDTVFYFASDRLAPEYGFFKYDDGPNTITALDTMAGSLPDISQRGLAWDGNNIIHCVVSVGGVDKLVSYNITGDLLTQLASYNIAFQLDRFNSGTVPNELEKAFGMIDKIIYEIKTRRGGIVQLQDLSDTLATNTIAITDNFLITTGGVVYKWTDVSDEMMQLFYTGGCFPLRKQGSFLTVRYYKDYWNEKDSIKVYDDNDVLEIWAKITKKYTDSAGHYHFDFDFYSNEPNRTTYVKTYSNNKTSEKLVDILDNKMNFNYQSSSIVATTINYNYVLKREAMYMFSTARWLERELLYAEPDGKTWSKAYDGLAKNPLFYPGTYNFRDDIVGSAPSGWVDNDDANCETKIIVSFDGHRKVIQQADSSAVGNADIERSVTQSVDQTIEVWLTKDNVGANTDFNFTLYEGATRIVHTELHEDDFRIWDGAWQNIKLGFLIASTFMHLKLVLDDSANTFDVYINGVLESAGESYENNTTISINKIRINTGTGNTGYICYADAIGLESDPNYNVGDNRVAWSLYNGHQDVGLIDIPRMARDRGGYFKGSLGITRNTVRYRDNATSIKPVEATREPIEQITGIIEATEYRDVKIEDSPEADQLATNRYDIGKATIQFIGLRVQGEGFLQEGKTVELENTQSITIPKGDYVILRYRRFPKQDITLMVLSDNIIFPHEFTSFLDTTRQQIHAANLQAFENQADIIAHHTPEGGTGCRLTNKTGVASVKGTIVEAHAGVDNAFRVCDANSVEPFGIVYDDGIADGSECFIVTDGRCQVLLKDATLSARNNWVGTSDVPGRADATNASPAAAPQHFREVGHCVESKAADTDVLAFIMAHFL